MASSLAQFASLSRYRVVRVPARSCRRFAHGKYTESVAKTLQDGDPAANGIPDFVSTFVSTWSKNSESGRGGDNSGDATA
ncbi:hypothetical protein N9061_00630 [bacterium]|nr:hypothetical protein [bacterium]